MDFPCRKIVYSRANRLPRFVPTATVISLNLDDSNSSNVASDCFGIVKCDCQSNQS
jgi:hypothetical protein